MKNIKEVWVELGEAGAKISSFGNIINSRGRKLGCHKRYRHGKPKRIEVFLGKKIYFVHKLMTVFLPPKPSAIHTVDHIDRNPFNNTVSNLRWATPFEQTKNRVFVNRNSIKITLQDVNNIFIRNKKEPLSKISKDYGISQSRLGIILAHIHPDY